MIGGLVADCAAELHRPASEVARTMSLPEIKLHLARAAALFARRQLVATHAAHLASAAKWSDDASAALAKFMAELAALADPTPAGPPRTATRADLAALFAGVGVAAAPPAFSASA